MEKGLAQYAPFIKQIKDLIYRHQYEALKRVNTELIELYWEIGEEIYHKQQEQGWGKSVVEILSKELQKEFPDVQGFSTRNLWRMRTFYIEYTQNTILPPIGQNWRRTLNAQICTLRVQKSRKKISRPWPGNLGVQICPQWGQKSAAFPSQHY